MKTKILIWVGLVLQLCSILFILSQAIEPSDSLRTGLEHLKTACPSEAETGLKTVDGSWVIRTSGDFFFMAGDWFKFIIHGALILIALNVLVSISLLATLRKKKCDSNLDSSTQ